jgi:ceramide glucosyltransferase
MTVPILAAASFCIFATAIHVGSVVITCFRLRRQTPAESRYQELPGVSLVRPLCGVDNFAADTLRSTFQLAYPRYEILFCVASATDPVIPLVEALIAEHAAASAKLLIGDDRVSNNPKLNNVVKGWRAAAHDWIVLADSNVLMPPDYLTRLMETWREDTGLVASPPIGAQPQGIWAELECAFLNSYEARWQYTADALGFGFAQGKTMLWRRADLDRAGGLEILGREVAEDAASTKVVRRAGLKVRLVDRPFPQPLGQRTAIEVWNRQLRWARLRRSSFLAYYLPEAISGGFLPMIALAVAAPGFGLSPMLSVISLGVLWYGSETLLAAVAGWHLSAFYPLYCLARDLTLPVLFIKGLRSDEFVWRGNEMQVERVRPRNVMARMRPRFVELAPRARRRWRSLRERMS